MTTIKCCIHCGRDTPNKSAICRFCTSGSERHVRQCPLCKRPIDDCRCQIEHGEELWGEDEEV